MSRYWRLPRPEQVWYQDHWLGVLLAPLGWLYCGVARLRRLAYQRGWRVSWSVGVPVIVVGNLTVGGTGKTPLVLWLAEHLAASGFKPGIALRGYGGTDAGVGPRRVTADSDPAQDGDEAVLLAQRAPCPVVVGRDRVAAARCLTEAAGCDLVLTDDGLQHYRLRRQIEILVIDGERGFGNRRCLPAGPLRESVTRQHTVDLAVRTGGPAGFGPRVQLEPGAITNLVDARVQRPISTFKTMIVTAVAGIGNPERFFAMLQGLGLTLRRYSYADHHRFTAKDVANWPAGPVLMTEKDAVKCRALATPDHWYLPVSASPEPTFVTAFDQALDLVLTRFNRIECPETGVSAYDHSPR